MDFIKADFWTAEKRAWLYKVAVSAVPLMISIGLITGDIAQLILNVLAAVLGVSASGMALTNLTPDDVFKIAVQEVPEEELEE